MKKSPVGNRVHNFKDITGLTYGRLTVESEDRSVPMKNPRWVCTCECGVRTVATGLNLRAGKVRSCGCLWDDSTKGHPETHGMSYTPEYSAWAQMWSRCTNPKHRRFKQYEGRRPPESWRNFDTFYKHVGKRPSEMHSLDRIRNDESYGPGNVKWSTAKEQTRNRSTNRMVIHRGVVVCLAEACEIEGMDRRNITNRMRTRTAYEASNGAFSDV